MSEQDKSIPTKNEKLRPHVYDGIQEYDNRLPNWWLWTLYGAMIFSFAYWAYYHRTNLGGDQDSRLEKDMTQLMLAAASSGKELTDDQLWTMSRDPAVLAAGKQTFATTCASCHGADLTGGIGVNLVDAEWVHGNAPGQIVHTIKAGVAEKGMPAWGPVLGQSRVAEVAAFILSHHEK